MTGTLSSQGRSDAVKVSAADTGIGRLSDKLASGTGVALAILNPGANEQLEITATGPTADIYVKITSADTNPGYLNDKVLVDGTILTKTVTSPAGNEKLTLACPVLAVPNTDSFIAGTNQASATGANTTLIGARAGINMTSSQGTTSIGAFSGRSITSGSFNTTLGYSAGWGIVTGANNVALGAYAGRNAVAAQNQVIIGFEAGYDATANGLVAIGYRAGYACTGASNAMIGEEAGRNITSGQFNAAIGAGALYNVTTGSQNLGLGRSAGRGCIPGCVNSVTIGNYAGYNTGSISHRTVLIGASSGYLAAGADTVAIGFQAGYTGPGSGCVLIGSNAGFSETGNDKLYIENSNIADPLIYGEFDNDLVRINGVQEIYRDSAHPTLTLTAAHNTDYDPYIRFRTDATPVTQVSLGVDGVDDLLKINFGEGVGGSTLFVFDSSGQLGMGRVPTAGSNLDVYQSTGVVRLNMESGDDGVSMFFDHADVATKRAGIFFRQANANKFVITHERDDAKLHIFGDGFPSDDFVTLDQSGNLVALGAFGVGVSTPASLLEVWDDDADPVLTLTAAHDTDYDPQIKFRNGATPAVRFSMGVDSSGGAASNFKIFSGDGVGGSSEFVIRWDGLVGIGQSAPGGSLLDIYQSSTTRAIACINMRQNDISEPFFKLQGFSANGILTQSLVEAQDVGTPTIEGYARVYVTDDGDQLTDQAYYIPLYTLAA